jgi:hypothetical protein
VTEDELAAVIAAAAIVAARNAAPDQDVPASRWRLANILPPLDAPTAGFAARSASRWSMSGRLDD